MTQFAKLEERITELEQELASTQSDLEFEKSERRSTTATLRERIAELEQQLAESNRLNTGVSDVYAERDSLETALRDAEQQLAQMRKWVNLGGAPSGKTCTWDPRDTHGVYGPGATLQDGTDICLIHDNRRLVEQSQRDRERIGELEELVTAYALHSPTLANFLAKRAALAKEPTK